MEPPAALAGDGADAGEVVDDAGVRGARRADDRGDRSRGRRRRRRPRGRRRRSAGGRASSTTSASISSSRSVLVIDECASLPTTTRSRRRGRPSPSRFLAVSRATASADRLPADPPETKQPPDVVGQAGLVGDQPQHGVLGGDRAGRLQPGDALDRRAGDQHVEQQAGLGRRGRDEAEEPRAVGRDDARRDHRGVHAEHLVDGPALVADRAASRRSDICAASACPGRGAPGRGAAGSRRTPRRCAPCARWSRRSHACSEAIAVSTSVELAVSAG